ncbi:MAG: hypothetical protein OET44_12525 [Gammaproteobacteria bacterium]|nr:hypothetical protein [Gammaproteobacteria bacterium]
MGQDTRRSRLLLITTLYGLATGVCLAIGVYSLFGSLHAFLVFSGERLIANLRFWLPISVFFLGFGSWLGYKTLQRALTGRHY